MPRFTFAAAVGAALLCQSPARAVETVVMTAGDAGKAQITFAFDKEATPRTMALRTRMAGVAGSVLSIYVDRSTTATFTHRFTPDQCRFPGGGVSECMIAIPQTDRAYADIVAIFKAGKEARITVEDGGVMAMDHTASLIGFTRAFDE